MNAKEITSNINENGGFDNYRNWNTKEKAQWVRSNYNCNYKTSMIVAREI